MLILNAHSRLVDALAFAPDGRGLAASGSYLACRVLDPLTGARRWTAAANSAFGVSLAFAPGAVLCRQGGLSVRDPLTGAEVRRFDDWCQSFALAPDGRTLLTAGGRDRVTRCDLGTGAAAAAADLDSGAINRLAVSPDGAVVAAVGCKRFYLLAARTLEVLAADAHRALSSGAFGLAFSPCGRFVVYSAGRTLFVWDVPGRREVARRPSAAKHVTDAAFTPDGRWLLTAGKEGAVRVWDTAGWECARALEWGVGPLRAVAVAADGTRAAAAGDTGQVVVWDLDA